MGNFFSNDSRYIELGNRIAILERKVTDFLEKSREIKRGVGRRGSVASASEKVAIPEGWMYPAQFCNRYKFVSSSMLHTIIRKNTDFFQGKVMCVDGRIYFDPVDMGVFFESNQNMSSKMMNQYHNWRDSTAELALLAQQAQERMSIVSGKADSFHVIERLDGTKREVL